ncbi:MAG: hypothetical protein EZS28_053953, partial [Streblomastix strix]
MTQASCLNAQAFFAHLRDGSDLNTTPSQSLTDKRDANWYDFSVFRSDCEITVTDVDVGPALKNPPMQETQFFIMKLMELVTGRNAFAMDFCAK